MSPTDVSKELRIIQEKYKNMITPTFQIRISDMAKDAADAIDNQQVFIDLIGTLPTCNECGDKQCSYRPGLGQTVRYNCPLFQSLIQDFDTQAEEQYKNFFKILKGE